MKVVFNESIGKDELVMLPMFKNELINEDVCGINDELKFLIDSKIFEGKKGQTHYIHNENNYFLIGLDEKEKLTDKKFRNIFAEGFKESKKLGFKSYSVMCFQQFKLETMVETLILADYEFEIYKTSDKKESVEKINLIKEGLIDEGKVNEHIILAEATIEARNLSNEPANVLTPTELALRATELGEMYGFEVEVLDKKQIEEENMKAFLSVAKASHQEPRFIIMRYQGNPDSKERLGFVGKGLTYDSGGLSIKGTDSMVTMKDDMSGASAVVGMMVSLARNNTKVNVTGVVAACENLISGSGYKPGDIIGSRGGKSIFVANTDAEGRLTLVDAIDYIIDKEMVGSVVDIATLTGSAVHALGTTTTAMISNNENLINTMKIASELADERVWELPIFDDNREQVKHHDADLKNIGGKPGTITAAVFLEYFVKDLPWVHLDIAGTSWTDKESGYLSKGATGVGVRLLYHYIKEMI